MKPAPIVKTRVVRLDPAAAFELFTAGIVRWWPLATYSCAREAARDLTIEPRVGGRVIETANDGSTAQWGTVVVWEPPHRFAMTWHPGTDPTQATQLEVRFGARQEGGCQVELIHDHWHAHGDTEAVRTRYDFGWIEVLERFTVVAETADQEAA